jgi:hypothetical protein
MSQNHVSRFRLAPELQEILDSNQVIIPRAGRNCWT